MSETTEPLKLRATDPLKLPLTTGWGSMAQEGEVIVLPRNARIFSIRGGELGASDVVDAKGPASLIQVLYPDIRCTDGDYLVSYCVKLTPDQVIEAIRAHLRHSIEVQRHNDGVILAARRLAKQDRLKGLAKDVIDADFGEDEEVVEAMRELGPRPGLRRAKRRDEVHTHVHLDEADVPMEIARHGADW